MNEVSSHWLKAQRAMVLASLAALLSPLTAHSFCGFYVAAGNAKLFNKSS